MGWVALAVAAAGAVAGSQKDVSTQQSESASTSDVWLKDFSDLNRGQSDLEKTAHGDSMKQFTDLMGLVNKSPGQQEVTANRNYQNSFADQLQAMLNKNMNPTAGDTAANYGSAQRLFAPRQESLNQQFEQETTQSNRLAARLGRSGNDPVLRNKLSQEKTRQQRSLDAEVGSYAEQLPDIQAGRLMNLGGYLSNLRGGLASQALQNRQTLLGLGQALTQQERDYRLQTAKRSGTQSGQTRTEGGGGLKGAIQGGIAGFGAGAGAGGK